jgi:hypothetical protein
MNRSTVKPLTNIEGLWDHKDELTAQAACEHPLDHPPVEGQAILCRV